MSRGVWRRMGAVLLLFCLVISSCAPARAAGVDVSEDGVFRILFLGCDASGALTDCMMVVSVDADSVRVLQIPRDTWVNYTDRDYKKINGAMAHLGPKGCTEFVSRALGLPINCYAALKLEHVKALVDAVGGVDVTLEQALHYEDPDGGLFISIPAGENHLDGEHALQFVRYRSGYANADLGRIAAQRLFVRAFARRCRSLGLLEAVRLTFALLPAVTTDVNVARVMRPLGVCFRCDPDQITMLTLPGEALQGPSGAWYYAVNRAGATQAVRETMMPPEDWTEADFDPEGLFDRRDRSDFHEIYLAEAG